ncbi:MAG: helix-turn-helix domain-containing protein [Cohaesibacter sp.]|nr:helix-turn-helix domain-containing protein [Cohaesibacter sp.]
MKNEKQFNQDLGFRLRQIRTLHKATQEDLGAYLNVSKSTINRYENAHIEMTCYKLVQLAHFFDVPIEDFLKADIISGDNARQVKLGLSVAADVVALDDIPVQSSLCQLIRSMHRLKAENDNMSDGCQQSA